MALDSPTSHTESDPTPEVELVRTVATRLYRYLADDHHLRDVMDPMGIAVMTDITRAAWESKAYLPEKETGTESAQLDLRNAELYRAVLKDAQKLWEVSLINSFPINSNHPDDVRTFSHLLMLTTACHELRGFYPSDTVRHIWR